MSVTSHKLKHHHYRLHRLYATSYKVWKHMDQQCSAIVKHKCSKCPPHSCYRPESPPISRLISDHLVCQSDVASTYRHPAYRMLTDPLLYQDYQDSVINRTEIRHVKKLQVWCYDEVCISQQSSLTVVCTHSTGVLSWNVSCFSAFAL